MENLQLAQIMDMCGANTGANDKCFYFCVPGLLHGRELREDSMTQIDYLAFIFLCHCARTNNQRTRGTRLLVGWSTHKFHETKTRADRGPAGGGGRTALYLLACEQATYDIMKQQRLGGWVQAHLSTVIKLYHTTMRWLGAQSISSRLLSVEVGKTPNVIENLHAEWQKMVMSNSPRWHSCAQASAQWAPVPREALAIGEILCEAIPWIAHVNSPWREHSRKKK